MSIYRRRRGQGKPEDAALTGGAFHTDLPMQSGDKRQGVELGALPIIAPNGKTTLGYSAAAVVHQGKGAALLEVAHFGPREQARATTYRDQLCQTIQDRRLPMQGSDLDKTVGFLTQLSAQNRLSGEWEALTSDQVEEWVGGDLSLTHTFNQVRPFTGLDRDYTMRGHELRF